MPKHDPVLVLEFAGELDKKEVKKAEDARKKALTLAAKKIRGAKSDEDFAKALMAFIDICSVPMEVEEED